MLKTFPSARRRDVALPPTDTVNANILNSCVILSEKVWLVAVIGVGSVGSVEMVVVAVLVVIG